MQTRKNTWTPCQRPTQPRQQNKQQTWKDILDPNKTTLGPNQAKSTILTENRGPERRQKAQKEKLNREQAKPKKPKLAPLENPAKNKKPSEKGKHKPRNTARKETISNTAI